ncbi:MAG: hypothetical protein HEQ35_15910 [Gloeotrichia echinulata IR180]
MHRWGLGTQRPLSASLGTGDTTTAQCIAGDWGLGGNNNFSSPPIANRQSPIANRQSPIPYSSRL